MSDPTTTAIAIMTAERDSERDARRRAHELLAAMRIKLDTVTDERDAARRHLAEWKTRGAALASFTAPQFAAEHVMDAAGHTVQMLEERIRARTATVNQLSDEATRWDATLTDERRRHTVTQAQLDNFLGACADQTIQIMELRGELLRAKDAAKTGGAVIKAAQRWAAMHDPFAASMPVEAELHNAVETHDAEGYTLQPDTAISGADAPELPPVPEAKPPAPVEAIEGDPVEIPHAFPPEPGPDAWADAVSGEDPP